MTRVRPWSARQSCERVLMRDHLNLDRTLSHIRFLLVALLIMRECHLKHFIYQLRHPWTTGSTSWHLLSIFRPWGRLSEGTTETWPLISRDGTEINVLIYHNQDSSLKLTVDSPPFPILLDIRLLGELERLGPGRPGASWLPEQFMGESGCSGLPNVWLTRSHGSILVVMPRTRIVSAHGARIVGREVHHICGRETVLRIVERWVIRTWPRSVEHCRWWRHWWPRRRTRSCMMRAHIRAHWRQETHLWTSSFPTPQLPHLLPPLPHQRFILGDPHFLPIDNAGPFRTRPVPVVWMLLHM